MNRLGPNAKEAPATQWPAIWAVCRAELVLRQRDSRIPTLIAMLAGLCLLLTPADDAPYAIFTVDGLRPLISVGTRIMVAAVVLNFLLFPCLLLTLGVGHTRDRKAGTSQLIATSPTRHSWVMAARMFASVLMACGLCAVLLVLICCAVGLREKHIPPPLAVGGYLLLTVPSALLSVPISAALDRWLGERLLLRALAAFAVFALLVSASAAGVLDVFGVNLLLSNLPARAGAAVFAIGFVSAPQGPGIALNIGVMPFSFLCGQAGVILGSVLFAGSICWLAEVPTDHKGLQPAPFAEQASALPLTISRVNRLSPSQPFLPNAALALLQHWFSHSPALISAAVAAFSVAVLYPHNPRFAPAAAFLLPLLIASGDHLSSGGRRDLDLSCPAFWLPTPTVFAGAVIACATVLPLLPVLFACSLSISLHLLVGIGAASLWLSWMCMQRDRPLLAIATYASMWYLESFSTVPASFDLLGLQGSSGLAFGIVAAAFIVLLLLCLRGDRVGRRTATYSATAERIAVERIH